ncbi:MAG: acetyl-CoA carboxylase biotin carboxyl carrier protein [Myxococcaceae bacterium]|nr:acetyl-CoA carboxylase biotin carboxyl carrier protein [Myxococcaceae bacterium]
MADKKKSNSNGTFVFGKTSLDVEALRQIVEVVEASEISRLVWQNGDEKLIIRRGNPVTHVVHAAAAAPASPGLHVVPSPAPAPAPAVEAPRPSIGNRPTAPAAPAEKKGHVITSPFVGTFYRNPSPDQPPYVEVGSSVKKGQTLCIIEAMKLMNEIESEVAGKVAEVLVENAQPVEFGQALFRIEPA